MPSPTKPKWKRCSELSLVLIGLVTIILLFNACGSILRFYFRDTADTETGSLAVKGIEKPVTVRRDNLGVPFIEAESMEDLVFAVGYVNATDRLNQMIGYKLMSQGRLSEMMGAGALDMDLYVRALNLNKAAEILLNACSPDVHALLSHYCRGVNAYIEGHLDRLPPDLQLAGYTPDAWRPIDCMSLFALLNLGLAFNFHEEINGLNVIQRVGVDKAAWLFPIYPDEPLPIEEVDKLRGIDLTASAESLDALLALQQKVLNWTSLGVAASNNWAIAGSKTKNGGVILANDTHLPLSLPSIWNMMQVRCPTYEAAGISLAGLPAVVAGYNGHVAWGMTMVMADNQDVYLEKLKRVDGKLMYLYRDEWIPAKERREVFKVKGEDEPVARIIYETRHGAIMNDVLRHPRKHMIDAHSVRLPLGIAVKWAVFEPDETVNAFFALGRSRSVAESVSEAKKIRFIPLNILFADRENIAWQVTGRYPLRSKGRGLIPSPGWTGVYEWNGYLDPERQPGAVNPPKGYLATANNRTIPADADILLSSSWHYPQRIERIREMIEASNAHTLASSQAMQLDTVSLFTRGLKNLLREADFRRDLMTEIDGWQDETQRKKALAAMDMLDRFDGDMQAASTDAPIVGALLYAYTRNTFLDELGPTDSRAWVSFLDNSNITYGAVADHLVNRGDESPFWDNRTTPRTETKAMIVARSLADAYNDLEETLGRDQSQWQWGKLHTYYFKTESSQMAKYIGTLESTGMDLIASFFNRGPYPAGGSFATVNVAGYSLGNNFDVWLIPAMRLVVDFSRDEPMVLINSTGQSDNPVSPHYEDGIHAWLEGRYQPFPFQKENIDQQYSQSLTFVSATVEE